MPIFQGNPDDLGARPRGPVPRSVLGDKQVAAIFLRKLSAGVEREPQRGAVRREQDIRNDHFALQLGMRSVQAGVWIAAGVVERPAVKPTLLYRGNVVRDQVIAQLIALVHRTPQLTG